MTSIIKKKPHGNMMVYDMAYTGDGGRHYSVNGTFAYGRYPFMVLRCHQNHAVTPVYCTHTSEGTVHSTEDLVTYSDGVLTVDNTSSAWAEAFLLIPEGRFTPA